MVSRAPVRSTDRPHSPAERVRLIAEVCAAYARIFPRLRRSDLAAMATAARARSAPPSGLAEPDARRVAWRLGHVVRRVLRVLPADDRCLIRSLILVHMLARRGIAADLVIGVDVEAGFKAHAWVEYAGRPVIPDLGYADLYRV